MTDTQGNAEYLIRKGAYWYRPKAQGYTINVDEAGRYTEAQARSYTHPNGIDGPRDGMSYVHENEIRALKDTNPAPQTNSAAKSA
jgi:hypothetical protein